MRRMLVVLSLAVGLSACAGGEGSAETAGQTGVEAKSRSAEPGKAATPDTAAPAASNSPGIAQSAIAGVIAAFGEAPLVGISEAHGMLDEHEFLNHLLHDARFPQVVDDIVVEFGSARYQAIMDRYIAGEMVDERELQRAWLDTTQVFVWESPIYAKFFALVRAVNAQLPENEKIRVLLGDPPIDWASVQSAKDYVEQANRNEHYANLVLNEVLDRGRSALLIAGGAHLMRLPEKVRAQFPEGGPNETAYIEKRYPGSMFLIEVHYGQLANNRSVEYRLLKGPVPSLTRLDGSWLENLKLGDQTLAAAFDAYLFLGPGESLRASHPDPSIYEDDGYFNELERRWAILQEVREAPTRPLAREDLMRPRPEGFLEWQELIGAG